MSRLVNLFFALALLAALVIALDPEARRKTVEAVQDLEPTLRELDDRVIINVPHISVSSDQPSTPPATVTPFATAVAEDDKLIPVTGQDDPSDEPFIQVNWDVLGDALREFWERLKAVEIDLDPNDNR